MTRFYHGNPLRERNLGATNGVPSVLTFELIGRKEQLANRKPLA
jgi:hypothetical protein